jgi:hypothetical protein
MMGANRLWSNANDGYIPSAKMVVTKILFLFSVIEPVFPQRKMVLPPDV